MKQFKKFYIEITNVCNLKCSFCPKTVRELEFMKIETFEKILDQIKCYTKYIYLHVKGEPFMHPKLSEILELCDKKGFRVNITTNGTLINEVKEKIISKKALRQINFSLHSFENTGDTINKDKYIHDILIFAKEASVAHNTIISLRLWNLFEDNQTNIELHKNRNILKTIEETFNLDYKIEEKVVPGKGVKIAEKIYLNQDSKFQWPDLKLEEISETGFCYGLRNQVAILVDGTVVPCCLDSDGVINLGNINEKPFKEILECERAENIIEGFSNRKVVEELCRKCGYRNKFNS